ncbi:pentatricopeptide repeat-containing protein At4g02750 [Selaginella moellendorffii]|uniref:pentatricopeptide repeat-containing protein At4g02750 n=1 Tax=Selaginella moellendorffii TaxID=88036 RepID=UPI000D1C88B8|nr:pentatricopeptide repeat-containing protein At4g02750 [Selaginella moellendorffii]|eukprot:XP_024522164.1 pentatricopeptide repeat-containing protein At4g02750 [Selaginella moellendorffii]
MIVSNACEARAHRALCIAHPILPRHTPGETTPRARPGQRVSEKQILGQFVGRDVWQMRGCRERKAGVPRAYAQAGYIVEARKVFEEMPTKDEASFTAMIAALGRVGEVRAAKIIFDGMPVWNTMSWNTMLQVFSTNSYVEEAEKMFETLLEKNVVSWTGMIAACGEQGNPEKARGYFDTMPFFDLVAWCSIVTAYAQNAHAGEAKFLFDMMPEHNLVVFNVMVLAYAQNGNFDEARSMFEQMPFRDSISWTAMGTAYAQNGHLQEAWKVFEVMPEKNLVSWNAMIQAVSQVGRLDAMAELGYSRLLNDRNRNQWRTLRDKSVAEALGHLYLMLLDGWEPNEVTYLSLVSACGHAGMLKDALSHFKAMAFDHRLRPQAGHFRSILDLLSRAGRLAEAKDLIQNMPFVPETPAWATLLSACGTQGDSRQESSSVAQSVLEMRSRSCGSYVLISNLYSAKKYARQ